MSDDSPSPSSPGLEQPRDPLWCAWLLRPAALPVIAWASRLGIGPNTISLASTLLALLAMFLLALGNFELALLAALLMNLVALGDCVDGGIARATNRQSAAGEWLDALIGYTVYGGLPLAVAYRAYHMADAPYALLPPEIVLLLGAATAILNLYARLLYQKYVSLFADAFKAGGSGPGGVGTGRIFTEFGLVGLMMPLLVVAVAFGAEAVYVLFYSLLYGLFCAGALFTLLRRVWRG